MDAHVSRVLDQVPFTADDLPGYAGRLFDYLLAHPDQLRLATWHRLERSGTGHETEGLRASMRQKTETIAAAQAGGRVAGRIHPEDLLAFTLALTNAWMPTSPVAAARRGRRAAPRRGRGGRPPPRHLTDISGLAGPFSDVQAERTPSERETRPCPWTATTCSDAPGYGSARWRWAR